VRSRSPSAHSSDRSVPPGRALFDEIAPFAWRTLRFLGVPEDDLPDLTQEVLIIVHHKAHTFEGRAAFKTWVYRICHRTAIAFFRKTRSAARSARLAEQTQVLPVDPSGRIEARSLLKGLLSKLDEDKRVVFVLYEIEGLSMREISEVLECPLQTAYSRLHAARRLLEQEISERCDGSAA
jgi:RNA polymerase sigma-70 factor, ECF subfamily